MRRPCGLFMSLQADHTFRADSGIVHYARGQVQSISCFQRERLTQLRQPEGDASAHDVDDLVITVRVRGVSVEWTVRPGVRCETFIRHQLPQGGFGWGC